MASFSAAASRKKTTNYPLRDSFILDSGTTCHIVNLTDQIFDFRLPQPGDYIQTGNSKSWVKGYRSHPLTLTNGTKTTTIILQDVAICPDLLCNLVSFQLLQQEGIW
jgi:hypothetical protein